MRLALLALAVLALAIALLVMLHRSALPPAPPPPRRDEPTMPSLPHATGATTEPQITHAAPPSKLAIPRTTPSRTPETAPPPPPTATTNGDAALAAWHARSSERDYAYWDMKLNLLRKVQACVGDKLRTEGAAEVNFHFKRQDSAWVADRAEVRDPSDEERAKMGAVDFRGADRELAQRCISEAFEGTTMPVTGGTDALEQYEVRGQVMFPTSGDRAWKETGVSQ
jgi:hypothetical protein